MSKLSYLLLAAAVAFSTTSFAGEKDGEWTSLFDGKTLNGWKGYNGVDIAGKWMAEDGTLHLDSTTDSKPYTNIITCLLYTSPSPRDTMSSRMPSSA